MVGPNTLQTLETLVPDRLQELQAEATQERLLRSAMPIARPLPRAGTLGALVLTVLPAVMCCPYAA